MANISCKFGNYDFDAEANMPESFEVEKGTRLGEMVIPRRHGSIVQSNPFHTHKIITMRGSLTAYAGAANPPSALLDSRIKMYENLVGLGRQKLQEFDDRYIFAVCTQLAFSYPEGGGMETLEWAATFQADVPFWEDVNAQNHTWMATGSGTFTSSANKTSSGTAPTPPKFTTTISGGTLTAISFQNVVGGVTLKLKWTGSQGVGSLIVDMDAKTIKDGTGANKLSGLSNTAGERDFWEMKKGVNAITVSITGTGLSVSTLLEWRDRWY